MAATYEMKRPWNGWQILGALLSVAVPFTIFCVSLARTQSEQGVKIQNLETNQYTNQIRNDKQFDKINEKLDKQNEKMEQVRVLLESKVNR